jgi:hypothetical protein
MVFIYFFNNCFGDNNKVYVGKSKNPNKREKQHQKNYGNNIRFTILEEINSFNKKEWVHQESYWIEQFNQWGFNVINKNVGGGGLVFHNQNTKNIIGLKNQKPKPQGFGEKISQISKGISRNKGKSFTPEHKKNLSKSLKGKKSNFRQNQLDLNIIKEQYKTLSSTQLSILYKVSFPTMVSFLKENNIYTFRKNYRIKL